MRRARMGRGLARESQIIESLGDWRGRGRRLSFMLRLLGRRSYGPSDGFRRPQDDIGIRFGWDRVAYRDLFTLVIWNFEPSPLGSMWTVTMFF